MRHIVRCEWLEPDGDEAFFDSEFCSPASVENFINCWSLLPGVARVYVL